MLKHPIQKVQTSLKNQQQNKKDKPKKANRSTKPPANATHMGMTWNSFESKRNRQECSRERPCEECPSRRSYHNARNVEVYGHGHGQCGLISSICFLGGCVDAENHVIHLRGLGGSRMDVFFHGFFHWTWLRLQHLPKFLRCSVHFFRRDWGLLVTKISALTRHCPDLITRAQQLLHGLINVTYLSPYLSHISHCDLLPTTSS